MRRALCYTCQQCNICMTYLATGEKVYLNMRNTHVHTRARIGYIYTLYDGNNCLRVNWHNVNYDTVREHCKYNLPGDQGTIYCFVIVAARCNIYNCARTETHGDYTWINNDFMHYRQFSDDSTIRREKMECLIKYKFFEGHTFSLVNHSFFNIVTEYINSRIRIYV